MSPHCPLGEWMTCGEYAISSGGSGASSENSRSWAGIAPVDDQETRSR